MTLLSQQLLSGIAAGSLYGLVALGLSLIYYLRKIVQIANGQVLMVGAYFGLFGASWAGGSALPMLLAAAIGTGLLGVLIERAVLRPFQNRNDDYPAIVMTIALGTLLEEVFRLSYNRGIPVRYPEGNPLHSTILLGELRFDLAGITAFTTLAAVTVVVHLWLHHTRIGTGMRVMAGDLLTARLLGIPVNRLALATAVIASALAGIAGVLLGIRIGSISPAVGGLFALKAVSVALAAGLGNVTGAAFCGLLLGVSESLIQTYTNGSYQDALAFGLIIIVLLFRPRGLFGVPGAMTKES